MRWFIVLSVLLPAAIFAGCGSSTCTDGQTRCVAADIEICASGAWEPQTCAHICEEGGHEGTSGCALSSAIQKDACTCTDPDGDTVVDGDTEQDGDTVADGDTGATGCANALPLTCGDRFAHSTIVQGHPNEWPAYACTARLESGPETLYAFSTANGCRVTVRLTDLQADIDLLLLPECDPWSCRNASSTPLGIQDGEDVSFDAQAGQEYFIAVDGYAGAAGSYGIEVDCQCIDGDASDGDRDGETGNR